MKYIKWVNKNINSLENKNIVVTGATGSIGIYTVKYLAYLKANIIIAVRNEKKGNALIQYFLRHLILILQQIHKL